MPYSRTESSPGPPGTWTCSATARAAWKAADTELARAAVQAFDAAYGAKFPKAAAKITDDADQLLAFYDFPAKHWVQLRTTNPIESTFATVRHRTKVTKGPGSRVGGEALEPGLADQCVKERQQQRTVVRPDER